MDRREGEGFTKSPSEAGMSRPPVALCNVILDEKGKVTSTFICFLRDRSPGIQQVTGSAGGILLLPPPPPARHHTMVPRD